MVFVRICSKRRTSLLLLVETELWRRLRLRDLAEKIAPSAEDLPSTIERIRHWTREGLLTPVGERNPGTGHKRRYDEEAVVAYISDTK